MITFTPEQIQDNWNKLIKLIEDTFDGDRKDKLLKMYKHFEDRMCVAPASGQEHFHLCPLIHQTHSQQREQVELKYHMRLCEKNLCSIIDYLV